MTPLTGTEVGAVDLARMLGAPHDPTPEQVAIIEAPLEPLLVIAGAGSGKTETMAARVVWLVAGGHVRPEEVLGLTFTRKAAGELAERVGARLRTLRGRALGPDVMGPDRPRITTYNAYAAGLVSDHGLRLGADPEARLLTEAGRWQIGSHVVETWLGDLTTEVAPSTLTRAVLELAGALAEHLVEPEEAVRRLRALAGDLLDREPVPTGARRNEPRQRTRETVSALSARAEIMALVRAFGRAKAERGAVDFADQVALACRIAREVPAVVAAERARYRVVLLDEYQDTSVAQVHLLAALFGDGHPVTAVGDPHQAIYGWRGASAGAIERFADVFPAAGPDGTRRRCRSLTLATSWRNDRAVLAVANRTAGPLRAPVPRSLGHTGGASAGSTPPTRTAPVHLPVLEARPGAGEGAVVGFYAETSEEEASRVASFVAAEWARPGRDGARPTCAVLCRARAQMPLLAQALREAGLPVEVVGLGGLLGTPEVRDLHSALLVAHDPARSDAAMRLLTKIRLGIADLDVVNEYARALANESRAGRAPRRSAEGSRQSAPGEAPSILEAIDRPPPRDWTSPRGRSMSATGLARVTALGDTLRAIRALGHLSLPELVGTAERLLGLDIEVLARPGADPRHARRHLDAFAEAAAAFASGSREVGLGAFLAWLDAAEDYERGLDTVEAEPDPAAVQVMTVHAAKGLEWDVVAVPGLMDGAFPAYDGRPDPHGVPRAGGWLTSLATLPYPLRGDSEDLPALDLETPADHSEMAAELEDFRRRCGAHVVAEERRLAYVAFTRARRVLVLSGAWWKEGATTARPPSRFLGELERAGLLAREPDTAWERPAAAENPGALVRRSAVWPRPVEPGRRDQVRRAVETVRGAQADLAAGVVHPGGHPWWTDAALLLEEEAERRRPRAEVALPAHLSASAVVQLAGDPDRFALDRRRPVPREPTLRARRGTRFHAWLEQHFGAAVLLDLDEFAGADDVDAPTDAEFVALQEAFLASPWAARRPIAVEVDLETPVAGTMVRCRVDAVFATEHGVEVVDWKTGAPARDPEETRARQMQLALYRLAWSRLHGVPLKRVSARFVHVAHGVDVPAEPMTEQQILDAVTGLVTVVDGPRPGSPG